MIDNIYSKFSKEIKLLAERTPSNGNFLAEELLFQNMQII